MRIKAIGVCKMVHEQRLASENLDNRVIYGIEVIHTFISRGKGKDCGKKNHHDKGDKKGIDGTGSDRIEYLGRLL
jgi:hypothetical protein